jgi:NADH-quinone oxidoreductase subunit C
MNERQETSMADVETLLTQVKQRFADVLQNAEIKWGELTLELQASHLRDVCMALRDERDFKFEQLVDVCGVDYAEYGVSEWETTRATGSGFERGVEKETQTRTKPRFAVVYHLLSLTHNHRIRIRVYADGEPPLVDSVVDIWPSANWFEREAFDLFGILFKGHPDLRRVLTDYGFIGHPFRKDFPLIGHVEVRYDAETARVVYQPVTIEPRTLVPKVIREDHPA